MTLTRILGWLCVACLMSVTRADAVEYRFLVSFDRTTPITPLIGEAFAKEVENRTNGRIRFRFSGPETVAAFEQLQPVSAGLFQLLLTSSAYHTGTTTAGSLFDGVTASAAEVGKSGLFDLIDKEYQKLGL